MAEQLELMDMTTERAFTKRRRRHELAMTRWGRRDQRAKTVKLCGVCQGTGRPGRMRSFTAYYWHPERGYIDYRVFVRRLACWACRGSGLNCSQQRARELEHG